jgi:hypothetical protein
LQLVGFSQGPLKVGAAVCAVMDEAAVVIALG